MIKKDKKEKILVLILASLILIYCSKVLLLFKNEGIFGTLYSPYSDSLAPWLHGTMVYYFHDFPISYLYRPTIGIIYSSFILLFDHFYFIPYFLLFYSSVLSFLLILTSSFQLNLINLIVYFLVLLNIDVIGKDLSPHSISPDFFSFTFTLIGIQCFLYGYYSSTQKIIFLGMLHIGIALAIRGLQLPGLIIFSFVVFFSYIMEVRKQNRKLHFLLSMFIIIFSFFPFLLDVIIQKKNKVINNGEILIYCVYKMPYHTYSSECQEEFQLKNMGERKPELYSNYVHFLFSESGKEFCLNQFRGYSSSIIQNLSSGKILSLFLLSVILFLWINKKAFFKVGKIKRLLFEEHYRIILPLSLFLFFFLGFVLFVMLGVPGGERTLSNLNPALYFFLSSIFIFPTKFSSRSHSKGLSFILFISIVVLLLLYFGNFIFPKPFAKNFNSYSNKQLTVFKLSDDIKQNKSLWYSGDGHLFYTFLDQRKKWKVFSISQRECSDGTFNGSYYKPCRIDFSNE